MLCLFTAGGLPVPVLEFAMLRGPVSPNLPRSPWRKLARGAAALRSCWRELCLDHRLLARALPRLPPLPSQYHHLRMIIKMTSARRRFWLKAMSKARLKTTGKSRPRLTTPKLAWFVCRFCDLIPMIGGIAPIEILPWWHRRGGVDFSGSA